LPNTDLAPQRVLPALTDLARRAGEVIMRIYAEPFEVRGKQDKSPVTDADHAAEAVILAGLQVLTPGIKVVAEEEVAAGRVPHIGEEPFWLVDPLDGTKEFVARNGEFTVNIALIDRGRPTQGVVLAPATGTLWRGAAGHGAECLEADQVARAIHVRNPPPEGVTVFASRSHAIYSDLDIWLRNNNYKVAARKQAGSSLKFCLIAAGEADVYPRFGPTMEWDTAAGQAVLEAAGGEIVTPDGPPLRYGKAGFRNPHFIARGSGHG
jgi:3'(2'), 5'-bisphosphate nucleotidase